MRRPNADALDCMHTCMHACYHRIEEAPWIPCITHTMYPKLPRCMPGWRFHICVAIPCDYTTARRLWRNEESRLASGTCCVWRSRQLVPGLFTHRVPAPYCRNHAETMPGQYAQWDISSSSGCGISISGSTPAVGDLVYRSVSAVVTQPYGHHGWNWRMVHVLDRAVSADSCPCPILDRTV